MGIDGTSSAPVGTGPITNYAWNCADGTTGTGPVVSHAYAAANTYTVVLTVTDSSGKTGVLSQNVPVP